jgi:hypothetical protein
MIKVVSNSFYILLCVNKNDTLLVKLHSYCTIGQCAVLRHIILSLRAGIHCLVI